MTTSTVIFLVLRVAHVLLAATWLGATAFIALFLMPSVQDAGPGAGPVMGALLRRKLHVFMASLGGTVVLSGMYLYWRFTGGFNPELSASRSAMVFGTGGIAGILALIVGGAIVSRSSKKMAELGARLPSLPDGPQRAAVIAEMTAARQRSETFGRIVLALQVLALIMMALGHYV